MRLKQFVIAPILGLSLVTGASAQGSEDPLKRPTIAAYFSQACRERAAAVETPASTDVDVLFAAVVRHVVATGRAAAPDALDDDCSAPVILLINLLRNNGVDAAFAFVSMLRTTTAGQREPSREVARVVVYVPTLDRYVDPSAPVSGQNALDAIALENTERMILHGPSLTPGRGCLSTCMTVVTGNSSRVRVKTETVQPDHARGGMVRPPN